MNASVLKYVINTVHLLHVSATHVAMLRQVHYEECIHRDITKVYEPVWTHKHRYVLNTATHKSQQMSSLKNS
jgi:hypothetical protein